MPSFWTSRKKTHHLNAATKSITPPPCIIADKSQTCSPTSLSKLPCGKKVSSRFVITDKQLGSGAYGSVYLGEDKLASQHGLSSAVAIKCIPEGRMKPEALQREIGIMKRLSQRVHPNIISYYGSTEPGSSHVCLENGDESSILLDQSNCIMLEPANGGELFQRIVAANGIDEDTAAPLMRQIAQGLLHAHENGVAHRDLKLENVLLAEDSDLASAHLKIIDWGLAHQHEVLENGTVVPEKLKSRCGSRSYMAPEVINRREFAPQGYDAFAADVWSFGICIFACLLGFFPFEQADPEFDWRARKALEAQMRGESTVATIFGFYPKRKLSCSSEAAALMDACLSFDSERRCTLIEAIYSDWLSPSQGSLHMQRSERDSSSRKQFTSPPSVKRQDSQSTEKSGSSVGSSVIGSVHRLRELAMRQAPGAGSEQLVERTAIPRRQGHWVI